MPFIPSHICQQSLVKNAYPHRLILGINGRRAPSARLRMHRATPATWRRSKSSSPQNDCRDWSICQGGSPSSPLGIRCCRGWQKPRSSPTRWRRRGRRNGRRGPCLPLRGLRHGVWGFEKVWLVKWFVRTRHECHVGKCSGGPTGVEKESTCTHPKLMSPELY